MIRDPVDAFIGLFAPGLGLLIWATSGWRPAAGLALVGDVALAVVALTLFPRLRGAHSPLLSWLGVVLPLFAFYGLYRQLGLRLGMGVPWHDASFVRLEGDALWGESMWSAGPLVGEWFAFAYMSYVPLLVAASVALVRREPRAPGASAERLIRAVCISWAACYVIALLYPVLSPRGILPAIQASRFGSGLATRLALLNQRHGMLAGASFPSAHVAATVVMLIVLRRARHVLFWPFAFLGMNLGVGAVYLGYHYALDVVAGTVVGVGAVVADVRWVGGAREECACH